MNEKIFETIDNALKSGKMIVAIDGKSGSGKTTFAWLLQSRYDCNVFHMDDFFLRKEQRTPERYAETGGNVDRERFLEEVLLPLSKNETVKYRPFDCSTFSLSDEITVEPKKLTVIEGVYSMHPELSIYYDYSLFLDINEELQRERIIQRNPFLAERFFKEWIPLENKYFSEFKIKEQCDKVVNAGTL